ncbi:MAG: cysteine--tRNA ligase [Bacillota bacterium]|nr:cysteine--tRNA ligase [Bacillota bacterium]
MRIFNTLTRQKEDFVPLVPGRVSIYCCGPTVYDFIHLGNARPLVVFDVLRRHLESSGLDVCFVQNVTDIEDKIIRRAEEEGVGHEVITARFHAAYHEDAAALGVRQPDSEPRATAAIPDIIAMIERLIAGGHAYVAGDGVYYATSSFPDYGRLSGYDLERLEEDSGGRQVSSEQKRDPADFALWKLQKPGEPGWPSPWGSGRPGWHIECSAMVLAELGETIDIHCGGQDLIFPHHENEIAQSVAANAEPLARYWMHNGYVNVDQAKMSKSLGNFFTVRDLLERFSGMVLRFFILSGHYRSPINFSTELLEAAAHGWERITTCVRNVNFLLSQAKDIEKSSLSPESQDLLTTARQNFKDALDDDLNTADALASVFDLVRALNSQAALPEPPLADLAAGLETLEQLLAVLGLDATEEATAAGPPQEILQMLEARQAARAARNWAEADRLRDAITAAGWRIEDTPRGAQVYRA